MNYELIAQAIPGYSPIEQILSNRGFEYKDINHYLNTTDEDILDPSLIKNIEDGAKMLIKNISKSSKTVMIVDSDCDGFTSSALLTNYLHKLFPAYASSIIHLIHPGKEHGIILDELPPNIEFIIAADSATNDYEQHKILKEKGIDILIIDHHEADYISENACVINNQMCDYPTKSLSGAGMVYKFCSYIDKLLGTHEAEEFIDLAALGIIADVMPLNDFETKRIIDKGIAQVRNPFIKTMVQKNSFSIGSELTPIGLAFYVAPYVNATIRVGDLQDKKLLFESMLDYKAYQLVPSTKRGCRNQMETIAEQACRNCHNVKNRQTKERNNSIEVAEKIIEQNNLLNNKILVIQLPLESKCNKNLTGLIANVLMDKYKRPVLLLNQTERDNEVWWEGSGRGYDKSKLQDFRKFLYDCGLASAGGYAQGHANAFGVGISDSQAPSFIEKMEVQLKDFEFSPNYKVDFIYGPQDCKGENILQIADFKSLWGQGVEEPKIAFEHISISNNNLTLMSPDKNPTIKITLPSGIAFIKFKSSEEEYELLKPETDYGCTIINIVGRCEKNEWNGLITPQILIEDYEVVSRQKYYF